MSESSTIRGYELNTGKLNTPLRKWIFYTVVNLILYVGGVNPVIFGMQDGQHTPTLDRFGTSTKYPLPWYIYLTMWGFVPIVMIMSASGVEYLNRSIGCAESPSGNVHQLYPVGSKRDNFFQFLYQAAITLQPFIVVGFWGLVAPNGNVTAVSVVLHGIAAIAIYAELLLGERPWKHELVKYIMLIPCLWIVIQFIWVIGMEKDQSYDVLGMDDIVSLILIIFALGFVFASFRLGGRVTRYRDERVGRFADDVDHKTTEQYDEEKANNI
jgi:hypothetical protein